VRDLLRDQRYRFFGNESFFNAGAARGHTRRYLRHGVLPPPFDPTNITDRSEAGSRIFTRDFQPLLDDLRSNPRYVLPIGSRTTGTARDEQIARNFLEEMRDRGASTATPGVLLLGAAHAAARPFHSGQTTTRMLLQRSGFRCTSILVRTNISEPTPDDQVVGLSPQSSTSPPEHCRLSDATTFSRVILSTREDPSLFRTVRLVSSNSGVSLADQFEFLVVARI
jgi:hypothetical protein